MKRRGFLAALAALPFVPALSRMAKAATAPVRFAWDRGRTLFVGKGEQFTTIQGALAQAKSGDTIFIRPGVYEISSEPLTTDQPGVSLIGTGRSPSDTRIVWKP